MPDFNADNILFGSSFDSTAFVAGITKSVESLKLLSTEQKKLQSVLTDTSTKLSDNSKELFATQRAYDNLDKGSKNYIESQTRLKTKIDELKTTSTQLNTTWANQKAALDAFNSTNATAIASFNKLVAAQKELAANGAVPIAPVLDPTQITQQLQNLRTLLENATGQIDFKDLNFEELHAKLESASGDIENLTFEIDAAKEKLATLKPGTQEFDDLNAVVQTGEKFLEDFNTALKETGDTEDRTGEKTVSMRTRIKLLREEMTRLEDAGKENTEQYKKVQLEAARLTDQFQDQQQAVKALSSDTKALDFGLAAINAAGAGMQVYLGVVNLLGLSEEDAAEAQRKLLAVMNLVQGAQQLATLLTKQNTIAVIGGSAATRAYAAVNGFLTTSFGAAATAATALRGALITTGIGALVVGVGFLVAKLVQMHEESVKAAAGQKQLNDAVEASASEYQGAVSEVEKLKEQIKSAKEGFLDKDKVVKQYNETIGKTTGQVTSLDEAEQALTKNGPAYVRMILLKAVANKFLEEATKKQFEAEKIRNKSVEDFTKQFTGADLTRAENEERVQIFRTKGIVAANKFIEEKLVEHAKRTREIEAESQEFEGESLTENFTRIMRQAEELAKGFNFDITGGIGDKTKKEATKKEPDNVFKEQLLALQSQLADIDKATFINADSIAAKVEADYNKAKQKIIEFLNAGKLTEHETDILITFLGVISKAQLEKDMAEFTKNVTEARRKLQDVLDNLAFEQAAKTINNNQDSFERESLLLTLEFQKQTDELIKNKDEQEKQIRDDLFLNAEEKKSAIEKIEKDFGDTWLNLEIKNANDQRDLALKVLDDSINDITNIFSERGLRTSELEQKSIRDLSAAYANGEITFRKYQDGLTKIQNEAQEKRKASEIDEIQKKIDILQGLVDKGTVTDQSGNEQKLNDEQIKDLEEKIRVLRKQLLDLGIAPKIAAPDTSGLDTALAAYQSFTQSILSFIEQINAAEQQRLDRSIALQQTRVENARFIAEKGNAEYLELEQKRLDSLIQKREAAAQKEIAINNALAASGAIVAGISAIAKAAETGGVIAAIAAAVAVIAAIASIYKFVSTLQPPVATFAEGTTYVEQGRHKSGKDTIPARVNIGEAIIPTKTNEAYHPAVKAIYDRSIPAKELNDFVEHYKVAPKSPKSPNHILSEFIKEHIKEKDITKENSVSTDVINEFVKFYKSEDHSSYNEVLSKFVEQYTKNQNTVASSNVINEFVKEFSRFSQFDKSTASNFSQFSQSDKNTISNDVLHEYIKQHENSTYAKVLKEFLVTNKSNEHSVTALNEFVKNYQTSAIDKIHESFVTDKELSVSKINEFVKKHEHTAYADVLHEFVKQSDSKRVSVQSLNEFVFNEFVKERLSDDIKKVHEEFISDTISVNRINEFIKQHEGSTYAKVLSEFVSKQDEKIHEQFISNKKSISTDVINKFIEHSKYANVLSEFLKQSDISRKTISVNKLNEFVSKQSQSAIDKVHEQFVSANTTASFITSRDSMKLKFSREDVNNISTDTIKRFVEENKTEHSAYANILNEFVKQTDKKVVSVNRLNEFVSKQNQFAIDRLHEQFISKNDVKSKEERFVSANELTSAKNISTDTINRFISEETSIRKEQDIKGTYHNKISETDLKKIHENSVYASILNEFVKQTDEKVVSVNKLNEFVRSTLNKKHENFVSNQKQSFENIYQNASYTERKLIEEYYPAIKAIHAHAVPAKIINEFVNQYNTKHLNTHATDNIPATAINEFVKHNTNKISTRTLNEFVNKHSDESVSHIIKEFLHTNKTNEKLVSIDKVNEFIKNKQDTRVVNETHVLSDFIAHYPVTKIPQLDYTRLHTATERSYAKDATLSTAKIEQLLTALNENVSQFDNVKMVFDENGFALSMLQAAKKEKLKWKS